MPSPSAPRRHLRLVIALIAIVGFVAACGSDGDNAVDTATDSSDPTADDGGVAEPAPATDGDTDGDVDGDTDVPEIFDFTLDDVRGGDPVDGASFAGSDVVVWFWAPWCTLCNQEAATMAALAEQRSDVTFLGMAGLDGRGAAEQFVDRHGLDGFPHAFDEDGATWQRFGVTSQASFAFVNDDGTFDIEVYGVLGEDELTERIDALVAA